MTTSECSIPTDFVDEFQATPFVNTGQIEFFHRSSFRYGNTNNILAVMQGTEDEQREYMKGVLYSSITLFMIVLVWMILLLVFKAMGRYQVGILSGRHKPIRRGKDNGSVQKASKRLRLYRMIVAFAGISIIISSILMSINGIDSLTDSLEEGRAGITIASNLTQGGIDLIDRVLVQNEDTGEVVETFLEGINGICPNIRDPICTDINDVATCNFDGIADTTTIQALVNHFRGGERSVAYTELVEARRDLEGFLQIAADVDDSATNFYWALYCAMIFSLCLAAISLLILVGIMTGKPTLLQCLRSWILIPAFVLFVILSFLFCLTFLVGTMVLADMCVDSPDPRIQILLDRFQNEFSPMLVEFANFYINQCPPDEIPQEVSDQITFFRDSIAVVTDFTGVIAQSAVGLQQICGFENADSVSELAGATNDNLCDVAAVTVTIREYFQCRNWYPLYETTIYEAMCYKGTEGFTWVASTQFVVVFMALILLTFRGAFYDLDIIDDEVEGSSSDGTGDSVERSTPQHSPRVLVSEHSDGGFELSPHNGYDF